MQNSRLVAASIAGAALLWLSRPLPPPKVTGTVQITNDGRGNGGPMLTDGTRLLFNLAGSEPRQLSVKGGEPVPLSLPMRNVILEDISSDRTELLVSRYQDSGTLLAKQLWVVPVFGGSPRRLGNILATERNVLASGTGFPTPRRLGGSMNHQGAIAWSPDGQQVVYPRENELHLARSDGTEVRKLATLDGFPFFVRWSPDGRKLRVSVSKESDTSATLWEVSIDDDHARPLFPDWSPSWYTCCGTWTADGRYFVFQSRSNIWATREKAGLFERASHEPVQLTTGPLAAYWPLPSLDEKRIFIAGYQARNEFVRYDLRSHHYARELAGVSGDYCEFSRDGKWVAYVSVPGGSLFRAAADGSQRLQLTWPPLKASLPHWSPDGKQIAFALFSADKPARVYVVAVDGTGLRQVTNGESGNGGDWDPSWSPDGTSIAFGANFNDSASQEFIRVVDLKTNQVSVLPGSEGTWSPRWSPDGRFIACLSAGLGKVMLYDLRTRKQSQLLESGGCPSWSWDGESLLVNSGSWCLRMRISDRKAERVTNLRDIPVAGWGWFAAAPNNSFITAVDAGTEEIFALDWKAP